MNPRDTVEQHSRGPVGARESDQVDMRRFFSHTPFERPVPTSVPQLFAPDLGNGFPSSGMPGAAPMGPPGIPVGQAENLGTDPTWAAYRPSAVNHEPGADFYPVPEDPKRNWTVRFPAMYGSAPRRGDQVG